MPAILIVDDEILTLRGIRDGIPWRELGIDTVLTAKNGMDAFEILDNRIPDILLTDVYMPRMDGIALAKKVRMLFPRCVILFLTGYTKEDYLRSAIEVRAEHYINKPVNTEELYEILHTIVEKIHERQKTEHQMKLSCQTSLAMLLSRKAVKKNDIREAVRAADMDILYDKPFCCAEFSILDPDETVNGHDIDCHYIQQDIMNLFTSRGYIFLSCIDPDNRIICFIFYKETFQNRESVKKTISEYRKNLPADCAIALSETAQSIEESRRIFLEAKERLSGSFYHGTAVILEKPLSGSPPGGIVDRPAELIKGAIFSGQYTEAVLQLGILRDGLTKTMPPLIYTRSLLQEIMQILKNQGEGKSNTLNTVSGEKEVFDHIPTLEGCVEIIAEKIKSLIHGHLSGKSLAEHARTLIKYELDNTNLSITLLCDRLDITAPYLCYLFKQQYHDTINHYINTTRIEKAKNLLSSSELKIYEIAEQCGFSNTNYFTRSFKKISGILPTRYRRGFKA